MVIDVVDDVIVTRQLEKWVGIFTISMARELEARVATEGFLPALDVEWIANVLAATTYGHTAVLVVKVQSK